MPQCKKCGMTFASQNLLRRHEKDLCIGQWTDDDDAPPGIRPEHQKLKELAALKDQKSRIRRLEDREEKFMAQEGRPPGYDVGKALSNIRNQMNTMKTEHQRALSEIDEIESHASDPLRPPSEVGSDDVDEYSDVKRRYQEGTLEDIRERQRYLEDRKRIIEKRLLELRGEGYAGDDEQGRMEDILHDQEKKTTRALRELKDRLDRYKVHHGISYDQFRYYTDGNKSDALVAQISALKSRYMDTGGDDPHVLLELDNMMNDALQMDRMKERYRYKRSKKNKELQSQNVLQLLALERENLRLQNELYNVQGQDEPRYRDDHHHHHRHTKRGHRGRRDRGLERRIRELENDLNMMGQQVYSGGGVHPRPINWEPEPPISMRHMDNTVRVPARQPYTKLNSLLDRNAPVMVQGPEASGDDSLILFLDFVTGLEVEVTGVRLVLSLFIHSEEMGEPAAMPLMRTESLSGGSYVGTEVSAIIAAKQPLPICPPSHNLGMVVEMQEVDQTSLSLKSTAWTKLGLYNTMGESVCGWWKVVLRNLPIRPHLGVEDLESIPRYGHVILHYRLLTAKDAAHERDVRLGAENSELYNSPPEITKGNKFQVTSPPLRAMNLKPEEVIPDPPEVNRPSSAVSEEGYEILDDIVDNAPDIDSVERTLGFQVDRLKHAEPGIMKVRLTAYYASTGDAVQSLTAPVTCSTSAVKSNFKLGYHVFGLQEATYFDVDFRPDMVLLARVYRRRPGPDEDDNDVGVGVVAVKGRQVRKEDEEVLVGWAAIPLVVARDPESFFKEIPKNRLVAPASMKELKMNAGTHTIKLYEPPVIDPDRIPLDKEWEPQGRKRYGQATLRLVVFHPVPRPGSVTPSECTTDDETEAPSGSWVPFERRRPLMDTYCTSDGFDLYVDGCRFLPDNVTVTKIRGRIMNRRFEGVGNEVSCTSTMDSNIYSPNFDYRQEFREPALPPSSTMLFKIYTIDRFSRELVLIGLSSLKLFVVLGTEDQPVTDQGGLQVSLNVGAHQLRVWSRGPRLDEPFTELWMQNHHVRPVLGATLLVRIVKAPVGPTGNPLTRKQVPQAEWRRVGLDAHKPTYSDKVYYSLHPKEPLSCKPSKGESQIIHAHLRRPNRPLLELVPDLAGRRMESALEAREFVEHEMKAMFDGGYRPFNMTYVAQYIPKHGFKIAIDGALNLPWHNFTLGLLCMNPPGAFYLGKPNAVYDRVFFTEQLDMASTNKSPQWLDGFKHFTHRAYHRNMTMIIHLQEVAVSISEGNYKYSLLNQAWTALPIFENGFVLTDTFQLPLFSGPPNRESLQNITKMPLMNFFAQMIGDGTLRLTEGASVVVRVCDGRREEELTVTEPDEVLTLNQRYLPGNAIPRYERRLEGVELYSLIPMGKDSNEFNDGLINKFKSLVYKLYEEDKLLE